MTEGARAADFIEKCRDPFFFIEAMWGLTPQPCYRQHEDALKNAEPEDWKAEWFGEELEDGQWKWIDFQRGKHITWQQCAILEGIKRSVFDHENVPNEIAVKTGNGIGKSCLGGWLIPWFVFVFPNSKVPCTAPTASQMNDVLWASATSWIGCMPEVYKDYFEITAQYIHIKEKYIKDIPGLKYEEWFARARTSRKENPEAFSGIHSPEVLVIADEASGVPDVIYQHGGGIKTSPFWIFVMFSNPTRLAGYFKKAFDETSDWRKYTFDSRQSPVVDWKFVLGKIRDSGYDSDDFRIFVKGEFPKADMADAFGYVPLFSCAEIEQAQIPDGDFAFPMQGIDPSGEGNDKSSFIGRSMSVAKILAEEPISSPKSVAAKGNTFISLFNMDAAHVVVDSFGSGANVAVEMARAGFDVFPLNVGHPSDDKRFSNIRAELCWKMREWIKSGGQLVKDKRWDELLNLRYRYNEAGKLQIMSKEKMKKEGIPSPNHADAFMLTFAVNDLFTNHEVTETANPFDVFG